MSTVERFEAILKDGADSASLRFALGTEYMKLADFETETSPRSITARALLRTRAIEHLRAAVVMDSEYSAAWKSLGRAEADAGLQKDAVKSYQKGIHAATQHGDVQVAREMKVFLKRLQKHG